MNTEDKKGLNKFQFSTEIDRADLENTRTIRIDPEVLREEMRKLDSKKKGKRNRNASNGPRRGRKFNNRKQNSRPNGRRRNNSRDYDYEEKSYKPEEVVETPIEKETPIVTEPEQVQEEIENTNVMQPVEESTTPEVEETPVTPGLFEGAVPIATAPAEYVFLVDSASHAPETVPETVPATEPVEENVPEEVNEEVSPVVEEEDTEVTIPQDMVESAQESIEETAEETGAEPIAEVKSYLSVEDEIPLLEDEEELAAARNRIISIINETDDVSDDTGAFVLDEIPTAENKAVSISEADIMPINPVVVETTPETEPEITTPDIPTVVSNVTTPEEEEKEENIRDFNFVEEATPTEDIPVEETEVPATDAALETVEAPMESVQETPVSEPQKTEDGIEIPVPKKDDISDTLLEGTLVREKILVDGGEDKVVEEVKAAMENRTLEDTTSMEPVETPEVETKHSINRFYLSFQARVGLLVFGSIVLFVTACFIIISTLKGKESRSVGFVENAVVHYSACDANDICSTEGETYHSNNVSKVDVNYHYEAKFDEKIRHSITYYIVAVNRIVDPNDSTKVFYEDEDYVVEKKELSQDNPAVIDEEITLDYSKYNKFINDYTKKYTSNVSSSLEAVLYIDDGKITRNVGSVIIPLGVNEFKIQRQASVDAEQTYSLVEKDWSNTNTIYVVVGSFFVLLSLFLLFHLTRLALAVTGKKSKYQEELMNILNEYDRLIVIARDGYESNVEKKVIKLASFNELLDARGVLNKPIIYSRINNVKSEFIVEDESVIYKFVLKEADVEKE